MMADIVYNMYSMLCMYCTDFTVFTVCTVRKICAVFIVGTVGTTVCATMDHMGQPRHGLGPCPGHRQSIGNIIIVM